MYTVHDRRLEQFLFFHDIFFANSYKLYDGSTAWEYAETEEFENVLKEWKEILRKRAARKANGTFQQINIKRTGF